MTLTRVLSFPPDCSIGTLTVSVDGGHDTRPAQGDVEVPAEASVMLQMQGELAALSSLPHDALSGVIAPNVEAGTLGPVARQTGLKTLVLNGTFTDADVELLPSLSQVTIFTLSSPEFTGACFERMTLPESATVTCWCPALTDEGLAALLQLRVDNMRGQATALSAELLDAIPALGASNLLMGAYTLDTDALIRLLERSPGLRSLHLLHEEEGETGLLDAAAVLELRRRFPRLAINGSWYAADAVERMTSGSALALEIPGSPEPAEPVELTTDNFDDYLAGTTPVLVDFTATWCGPCKVLKPTIDQITGELADRLVVGTLDIDDHKTIAERYGISAIPALLVFAHGEQVARLSARDKDGLYAELAAVLQHRDLRRNCAAHGLLSTCPRAEAVSDRAFERRPFSM